MMMTLLLMMSVTLILLMLMLLMFTMMLLRMNARWSPSFQLISLLGAMSPGFHADFSTDKSLENHRCYIPSLPHTCSGLVFLGRFWGPKYRTSAGVWMSRVYIVFPWYSYMIFFMTTPHHPDQNQPCKTKQNTLLSSAIHRNPTDDPDPAMVLQTQSNDFSSEKKGRFPLSFKLHLFVKFVWSQDTKLTQAVS